VHACSECLLFKVIKGYAKLLTQSETGMSMCRVLQPGQYSPQQLLFLQRCRADALRDVAWPFGVCMHFQFNRQQTLEMVAKGKPVKMNGFLSAFEDKFDQPAFVQRTIPVSSSTVCPVPLGALHYPKDLLEFVKSHLQV